MFWLLSRLVVWPVKAAAGTAKFTTKATAKTTGGAFKAGYRTGRVLGYRRLAVLGVGVGIGLLVAPKPGRELREKVRERLTERGFIGRHEAPASVPLESPSPLPDVAAVAASGNGAGAAPMPVPVAAVDELEQPEHPIDAVPDEPGASGPS